MFSRRGRGWRRRRWNRREEKEDDDDDDDGDDVSGENGRTTPAQGISESRVASLS